MIGLMLISLLATKTCLAQSSCNGTAVPANLIDKSRYPQPLTLATILTGDTEANAVWTQIQSTYGSIINSVPIKSANATYDTVNDPDCYWTLTQCTVPKHPGLDPDVTTLPEGHTYGLTFDDGPLCTGDPLYNFLAQQNQLASVMYIGSNVFAWPLQAQKAFKQGLQVAVHTWSHKPMTTLPSETVFAELFYTKRIIKDVIGMTPKYYRNPTGDCDDRVRAIAKGLGLRNVGWNFDTSDWKLTAVPPITQQAVQANYDAVQPSAVGAIVLSHELSNLSVNLFMSNYPAIKSRFAHIVPVAVGLS